MMNSDPVQAINLACITLSQALAIVAHDYVNKLSQTPVHSCWMLCYVNLGLHVQALDATKSFY